MELLECETEVLDAVVVSRPGAMVQVYRRPAKLGIPSRRHRRFGRIWAMKLMSSAARSLVVIMAMCSLVPLQAEEPKRAQPAAAQEGISVHFSPHGGCTEAVVAEIGKAKKSIKLQAYSFTSAPIAKAIVEAKERGVEVTAVLDKSQRTEKYSSATFLHNQGVPVFIDAKHAIAHNKIILIDGTTILTGSFNFTKSAEENNAENLLILRDKAELFAAYEKNFRDHLGHAEKYEGR